jgi:hypothetical protein
LQKLLQQQQAAMQMVSTIFRILYDTSTAVIRKIAG